MREESGSVHVKKMQSVLQRTKLSLLYRTLLDLQVHAVPPLLLQEPVSLPAAAWKHWVSHQVGISSQASNAEGSKIACLNEFRGVLHLGGEDVYHFLNGIITNDPNLLRKGGKDVMYTAFLNAQGRFLHDAFLYATGEPFGILADVDKAHMPALMRLLRMYKLRAKVDVRDVSDSFDVWARFGGISSEKALEDGWPMDPRTSKLGQRTILPKSAEPALELPASDSALYEQWRHSMGIAEGPSEIPSGSAVPLEYNLDGLNAISFTKGCYVGQELIARTHFRGIVRKRLLSVTSEPSSGPLEVGMDVHAEGTVRAVGKIVYAAGNSSGTNLALLRLQAAFGDKQLRAGSKEGPVIQPHRPPWWPPEWVVEEQE